MKAVVNHYTGRWGKASRPTLPSIGTRVYVVTDCDARELSDIEHALGAAGLALHFVAADLDGDEYRVIWECRASRRSGSACRTDNKALACIDQRIVQKVVAALKKAGVLP